jgi:hypothetical protein
MPDPVRGGKPPPIVTNTTGGVGVVAFGGRFG